jgi:hypothetical protein
MRKIFIYLIGFWPSNRKDKNKKDDKKRSNNSKPSKNTQAQQQDETSSVHSQNSAFENNDFNKMMGSMDGLNQIPSTITKGKCVMI